MLHRSGCSAPQIRWIRLADQ